MLQQLGSLVALAYFIANVSPAEVNNASVTSYLEDGNSKLQLKTWKDKEVDISDHWFAAPPLIPISVAASSHIRNPRCRNHSRLFLRQLQNFTLWAVEMFDAAAKIPVGMLVGTQYQMGHFDECLGISVSMDEIHGGPLKGQYCLAEIRMDSPIPSTADPYTMNYDPMISAWSKIKYGYDPSKYRRDLIYWALCVPDSCSPQEVNYVLQHELKKIGDTYGFSFTSKINPKMCHTLKPAETLTTGTIFYLAILISLIVMMILSSWYDFRFTEKMPGKEGELGIKIPPIIHRIILCFSMRQNLKKLKTVTSVQPAIDASHGTRFFSMLVFIVGHRLITFGGHPIFNAESEEALFRYFPSMMLANGALLVDGYFAVGGVLLSYPLLLHLQKKNGINLAMPIIVRFIRLTPTYMMLVFFYATLMPYLGSGPLWEMEVVREQKRCAENWWTNLLYINNYVNTVDMCMFQSWYLSADFHLYIISLVLTYCVWRWPRLGYLMLGIFTTLSIIIPFCHIYLTRAPALFQPYPDNLYDLRYNWFYRNIYVTTHNRAAPYFVGVIIGIIFFKLRNKTYKLPKITSQIAYFGAWGFGLAMIYSCYVFFIPGRPYNALEAALYGSLHRVGFGLAIAGFFIFVTFGQVDAHQRFLSSKTFVVLSRLTYGAYLAHTMGHIYDQGSVRVPRMFTVYVVLWSTIADIIFAFGLALFLLLLVEAPTRNLANIIFGKS